MNQMVNITECWCGCSDFVSFNDNYVQCIKCSTLINTPRLPDSFYRASDEDSFYSKDYWLKHQEVDLNQPNSMQRFRNDLSERCIDWMKMIMAYKRPPAKVFEMGFGSGSLLYMLKQIGFDVCGSEMSPWIVDYTKEHYGLEVYAGELKDISIMGAKSKDIFIATDVVEHLIDPVSELRLIASFLKDDGIFFIQTPCLPECANYEELKNSNNAFLSMLIENEHVFLYSQLGLKHLLQKCGFAYSEFYPGIFPYDMIVIASKTFPKRNDIMLQDYLYKNKIFLPLALCDLKDSHDYMTNSTQRAEKDSTDRLKQVDELTKIVHESETDRTDRGRQIEELTKMVHESEADRDARGRQIEKLTKMVHEAEADRNARGRQIEELTKMVHESEADRYARGRQIEELTQLIHKLQDR